MPSTNRAGNTPRPASSRALAIAIGSRAWMLAMPVPMNRVARRLEQQRGVGHDLLAAEAFRDPDGGIAQLCHRIRGACLVRGRKPLKGEAPDVQGPQELREIAAAEAAQTSVRVVVSHAGRSSSRVMCRWPTCSPRCASAWADGVRRSARLSARDEGSSWACRRELGPTSHRRGRPGTAGCGPQSRRRIRRRRSCGIRHPGHAAAAAHRSPG